MNVSRRPASDDDTAFARSAHHRAYRDLVERQFGPWNEAEQDRFFARNWREASFEVVLVDGVPCGYVCIEDRDDDVHVRELVIAPEFQGRGIGTTILRETMALARARGVPLHLRTARRNRALGLYRRLGLRETGQTDTHVLLEWEGSPRGAGSPHADSSERSSEAHAGGA